MDKEKLIQQARESAAKAYAPYSHFRVGAALLCQDGTVFTGSNVENRSYGLTNCAERSAIFAAVSDGRRNFTALAVYSPDADSPLPPCGACRQVISEFTRFDFPVLCAASDGRFEEHRITDLLPFDSLQEMKDIDRGE